MIMKHFEKGYVETAPSSPSAKSLSQIIVRSNNKDAFLVAASISSPYHSAPWLPCRPILPYQPRRSVRERLFYRGISAPLWPSGIALCFPLSLLPFGPFSFPFRVPLRCKFALIIFCFQILGSGRAELGVERETPTQKGMYIFHIAPDSFQSYDARLSGSGRNFSYALSDRPPCPILTGFMTKTGRKAKCIPFHPPLTFSPDK